MRREMLEADDTAVDAKARAILEDFARKLAAVASGEGNTDELKKILRSILGHEEKVLIPLENIDLPEEVRSLLEAEYELRRGKAQEDFLRNARILFLQIIDMMWRDHLEVMEYTRSSVGLRAYGQRDPLIEYKNEAFRLFKTFNENLSNMFIQNLFKINVGAQMPVRHQQMVTNEGRRVADRIMKKADGEKIGRNDPCPCGAIDPATGKVYKYKKCGLIHASHHRK